MVKYHLVKFPMGSLLVDSLKFLGEQLEKIPEKRDEALEMIRERAVRIRMYSRDVSSNQNLAFDSTSEKSDESVCLVEPIDTQSNDQGDTSASNMTPSFPMESASRLPPIPDIPGVDKDVLSNLLMSWFYVGYYTGLAEKGYKSNS